MSPFLYHLKFDSEWINATLYRAARTFLGVFVSYVAVDGGLSNVDFRAAWSASLLATILAVGTAMVNLPEITGKGYAKWAAVLIRGVKQFAQTLIAMVPVGVAYLGEVDWSGVLNVAAGSALVSMILGTISILPETQVPKYVAKHLAE